MNKKCYFCDADGQCLMYCDMVFKMCDNCGKDDEPEFDDERYSNLDYEDDTIYVFK